MRFSSTLLPISTCASSSFPSLILQRFTRGHAIWWHVLHFAICRELHSQKNWLEIVILHRQLPPFTSVSILPSLFRKLSMHILDFSFLLLKLKAWRLGESTDRNLFFSLWMLHDGLFNGSVKVGTFSVVAKISSSLSIKRRARPICLCDIFQIIQGVKSHALYTSFYLFGSLILLEDTLNL